ncbi:MAG: sugar ABC transporter permease [Lachnospiraceae bacterium]|jgi:putative aldouronate transport system permease protein|nr:sugar ABC transporter permease [Lachnospiraceae bacterium]MDE6919614.1 ABC transporter permease subunit [Lachnospiraceae bacterium]MDE6939889.1 ABC transporter permease subunit [Lachnospiraceae bacterium]MDE7001394.1 ABC transporter permease subunit [Lachnospiraceae bacterium]
MTQGNKTAAVGGKTEFAGREKRMFHLMMLPGMIMLFLFVFVPLFGSLMAFQNYVPAKGIFGSKWVGLDNFKFIFSLPDSRQVFVNTLIIAFAKLIFNIIVPVLFAILLNEITVGICKKFFQTVVYLPHFLSWVVLATVVTNMFSLSGPFNALVTAFGGEPVQFLADNNWFRQVIVATDVWKEFGYNSVVYLAALTGIDLGLYEAASIDGANRFEQTLHITLPSLMPTIILMTALNLGNILNAGFDQIFNLYNPIVYETGDIIDTYVYRIGMVERQYSIGTAVGLFKSIISFLLIMGANKGAKKLTGSGIF